MAFPIISLDGIRYLGNRASAHREVHDLFAETAQCQLPEILRAGNAVRFDPDTLEQAHREGHDNCKWCIGNSNR